LELSSASDARSSLRRCDGQFHCDLCCNAREQQRCVTGSHDLGAAIDVHREVSGQVSSVGYVDVNHLDLGVERGRDPPVGAHRGYRLFETN
jgi:hypothetical protein